MPYRLVAVLFAVWYPVLIPAARGQSGETHDHATETIAVPEVPDTGPRADPDRVAAAIVDRTNEFRKKEGRPLVAANAELTETARYFAGYMAKEDKYGHTADGNRPADRAKEHGYQYCVVLENIAYAFDSRGFPADELTGTFVTGWKESPGHRKNMLDPDVTETGVAVARSEKTGHYYAVQMFGRPKSAAIEFRIDNRSGAEFGYTIGEEKFTLPPRYVRTHTRCRPAEVKFRWPGDKPEPTTVKPTAGDRLVVTRDGGEFRVKAD